jgi:uncharacterized membrane protein YphA (DoxX/SURF4 family)
VGLAALVLVDLALRAGDLRAFYTDLGVLPHRVAIDAGPAGALSLGFLHGGVALAVACFAIHALAASAMLAGARTRLATIATWALTVSLHARNPLVEQGADDLLRVLLFWSMFLPMGARFSVDARRAGGVKGAPVRLFSAATVALLVQVAAVYACTYLHKSGVEWRDGTAAWVALSHDHFGRPWAQRALLPHPEILRALTRAVLAVEAAGPVLLLSPVLTRPARVAALAALLGLQIGLGATLNLAHFPWVSTVALVPFVPSPVWDAIERHARGRVDSGGWAAAPRLAPQVVAGVALAYVLAWSAASVRDLVDAPLGRPSAAGVALGVDPQWTMFAPGPARDSGWFVIPGELAGGGEVDLFPAIGRFDVERPVTWEKPAYVFGAFPGTRWLDYLMMLPDKDDSALWANLADWICREWNARHGGPRRLERLTITYMLEQVRAPGAPRPREPHVYWLHACEPAAGLTPATAPAP